MNNLNIAFPEKTKQQKIAIAKQFYKNLIDTFVETIKMLSISEDEFDKRAVFDTAIINELAAKGKSIQLHSGHQMNWEYVNWAFAKKTPVNWIGIYQPLANKTIDRIFYKQRAKFNTKLISTKEFKERKHNLFLDQYTIGLAADQNPGHLGKAYWLYFFNKLTPFVMGPDIGAIKNNTAVVFIKFVKVKRGFYRFESTLAIENTKELPPGKLTLMYRDFLEQTIISDPANYLWSHRRWKHTYDANNDIFKLNTLEVTRK